MKLVLLVVCLGILVQVKPAEGGFFDWIREKVSHIHTKHVVPAIDHVRRWFGRHPPASVNLNPPTRPPSMPTQPPTSPPTTQASLPGESEPVVDEENDHEEVDIGDTSNPNDNNDGSVDIGDTANTDDNNGGSVDIGDTGDNNGDNSIGDNTGTQSLSKCEKRGGKCHTSTTCPTGYKKKSKAGLCPTSESCCLKRQLPKDDKKCTGNTRRPGECITQEECTQKGKGARAKQWKCSDGQKICCVLPKTPVNDEKCTQKKGDCVTKDKCTKPGIAFLGKCSGADKVCCVYRKSFDKKCTGRKGPCGAKCQRNSTACDGGQGKYVTGLCGGPADRQCCIPGNSDDNMKLTHKAAVAELAAAGITLQSSGKCSNRYNRKCTSLEGIRPQCIEMLLEYKLLLPHCLIIVTGGTEVGHSCGKDGKNSKSHQNGWKIDVKKRPIDNCLKEVKNKLRLRSLGVRNSDQAPLYADHKGRTIAVERNHYDIVCAPIMTALPTALP